MPINSTAHLVSNDMFISSVMGSAHKTSGQCMKKRGNGCVTNGRQISRADRIST